MVPQAQLILHESQVAHAEHFRHILDLSTIAPHLHFTSSQGSQARHILSLAHMSADWAWDPHPPHFIMDIGPPAEASWALPFPLTGFIPPPPDEHASANVTTMASDTAPNDLMAPPE